ncbi:hypothetical protein [Anatilimnocola aggregata]|nr:hypothetical protein [Anatilimnocola aggregata]
MLNRYLKRLGEIDAEIEKHRADRLRNEEKLSKAKPALEQLLADIVVE